MSGAAPPVKAQDAAKPARHADRWVLERLFGAVGKPPIRLCLWDGSCVASDAEPIGTMTIRDRGTLYRLLRNPDLEFGDGFSSGRIEVEGDLVRFLEEVYRGRGRAQGRGVLTKMSDWLVKIERNTPTRARDNIYHHYDIGNDFYRLWLDKQMVYTCAYFPDAERSLEDAQIAKMDHVCRKVWLKPGESVVEAGCGWGALALHMARHYGVSVKAYNISKEQLAYARERARAEGLDDRVEFIEGDYREIQGSYDAFVSVGMLEHVGVRHYHELGAVMARSLKDGGRGLVHTIGRDSPKAMNRWIAKRIFPGANPPSLSEMSELFEPRGFSVLDVENLRLHYAKTLEHWLQRYDEARGRVVEMYDPTFVRMWRLYLAGSVAAFTTGYLQLFQVTFSRSGGNHIPWNRAYLYE